MIREISIAAMVMALAAPVMAAETPPPARADAPIVIAANDTAADTATDDDDDDDDDDEAGAADAAAVEHHDFGPSGIMAKTNREDLAPLTLASGQPVADAPYMLKSGGYYRIDIEADGSQELALSGGDFFRAVWINEIVVNDVEIRPMGVHSIEFDSAGKATMSFVAIMPGSYTLSIPGSTGETQRATFVIQ